MLASNCSKIATSEWHAPAPAIFSRTSPGAGFGRSTSSMVGKVFHSVKRTAFMRFLLSEQRGRACTAPGTALDSVRQYSRTRSAEQGVGAGSQVSGRRQQHGVGHRCYALHLPILGAMTLPHAQILTVTTNPALDVSTSVGNVVAGHKMRCGPSRLGPGGGGVNVSRVVRNLGGHSLAV